MRLFISHTINPNPTVNFHFIDLPLFAWFLVFQHESKLLSRRKGMAMIKRVNCNTMTIVNFTFIEL